MDKILIVNQIYNVLIIKIQSHQINLTKTLANFLNDFKALLNLFLSLLISVLDCLLVQKDK